MTHATRFTFLVIGAAFFPSAYASIVIDSDTASAPAALNKRATLDEAAKNFSKLPLYFEENQGQSAESVDFLARGPGYRVFLSQGDAVVQLFKGKDDAKSTKAPEQSTVRLSWVNGREGIKVSGEERLPGVANYYLGSDASKHHTNIPTYAKVRYEDLYPGTDLVFYGNQQELEYDLVVAPGSDPKQIRLAVEGAEKATIDAKGQLVLKTPHGEVQLRRPEIYQLVDGKRKPVEGRYVRAGKNQFGFQVAAYDKKTTLVIDPVLSYATYLGGSSWDEALSIDVDASGSAYVVGFTYSPDFPIANAYDSRMGNADDYVSFVSKLNPTGTGLVYSTYLGGSRSSRARSVAVDASGNAYVGGSAGTDFPTTNGAYKTSTSVMWSGYVAKFSPSGSLVYSTFVDVQSVQTLAIDTSGNAYFAGGLQSALVSVTPGAFQTNGVAYLGKLNPTGSAMVYATFFPAWVDAITVDASGSAYLVGNTSSTAFPTTVNAFQRTHRGGRDGFVSKLNPYGTGLVYSTYLGGTGDDAVTSVAVDAAGNAYVTGATLSSDFPVKNAFQPTRSAIDGDAFVAKLTPTADALIYSSYLGGDSCSDCSPGTTLGDKAHAIAVDTAGHAYVTGTTLAYNFPLRDSRLPNKSPVDTGLLSMFVSKVALSGGSLLYSTLEKQGGTGTLYVNWNYDDPHRNLAVDNTFNAYVTDTISDGIYQTTANAFQTTPQGGFDGFVSKLGSASPVMTLTSSLNPATSGVPITLTATIADATLTGPVSFKDGAVTLGTANATNGTAVLTTTLPAGIHRLSVEYVDSTVTADSSLLDQVIDPALACN